MARSAFGEQLSDVDVDEVYAAMNIVRPGLIRVESDEATYNLHIMLRFDLERGLLSGDLSVRDLPGEWNERIRADLGLEVPDDRRGCLQDVHWSMGAMGYFPTYTLGNLYADQSLWAQAQQAYFQAHHLEPDNPDYAYNLAVGLEHLSQPGLAARFYRRALELASHRNQISFDPARARERIAALTLRAE